jgi:beta-lactamase regulating signal transducer with metallopeptidase domain
MDSIFIKILNMSITASWLILAVLVLRLILKKAPKAILCALWVIVAIRLICPFSLESALSLIPSAETVSPDILYMQSPRVSSGIPAVNSVVNPVISKSLAPAAGASVNPLQVWTAIASFIWLLVAALMLGYALISYLRIKKKVRESAPLRDNIWLCDRIDTPFILGVLRPQIYLPSAMEDTQIKYVIAHENAHLKRRDHWWKPLGFVILAAYWFNPLCWLAYWLLCRDIEMACDERVVRDWDAHDKKAYSEVLLSCSLPRQMVAACPLAFGEVGVKERIKTVLNYKKPAFWIIAAAVAACVVVALCFLTNPKEKQQDLSSPGYENAVSLSAAQDTIMAIYCPEADGNLGSISIGYAKGSSLAEYLNLVSWSETNAPRDSLPSPGSIEFIINDDYRITVYDERNYVCISFNGDKRWYKGSNDDYTAALSMFTGNYKRVVSGDNVIPALDYTEEMTLREIKDSVFWLTISPAGDKLTPFDVYVGESKQYGLYNIYDAETLQPLDFMRPSGLEPQTYILQNAEYGRSYIVTLDAGEYKLCFGLRLQADANTAVDWEEVTGPSYQALYSWVNYSEAGYTAMVERAANRDLKRRYGNIGHLTPVVKLDSKEDFDSFYTEMSAFYDFTRDYEEYSAFEKQAKQYDESFFKDNSLFIAYMAETSSSNRHEVEEVWIEKNVLEIRILQIAPESSDTALSGWFIAVAIPKADIAGCSAYDAYICATADPTNTIPRGQLISSYFYEGEDITHTAMVSLYDSGEFMFSFSPLSSYIGYGTYTIEKGRLRLQTNDGHFAYIFDMTEDGLVFDADASSKNVWYSGLTDGAILKQIMIE